MDRLHEMEVFVAVAESGGFAKAGTRLRISPPAVTRAVSSLEERLALVAAKVRVFVDFAGPSIKELLRGLPTIPAHAPASARGGAGRAAPGRSRSTS